MNDAYAYRLMGNGEGEWEVSVLGAVRRGQHVRSLELSVAIVKLLASFPGSIRPDIRYRQLSMPSPSLHHHATRQWVPEPDHRDQTPRSSLIPDIGQSRLGAQRALSIPALPSRLTWSNSPRTTCTSGAMVLK
jgi:hypothetical protein